MENDSIKQILDDDEFVELSLKPNRVRSTLVGNVAGLIFAALFSSIFIVIGLLVAIGVIKNENGGAEVLGGIFFIAFGSIPLLSALFNFIGRIVRFKNIEYDITNKRIIIRSGIIGVDFKEINLDQIGAVTVRVDFLDKLVKPNTGTIYFGSASTPIVQSDKGNTGLQFKFADIENPYEEYKRIKAVLNKYDKK